MQIGSGEQPPALLLLEHPPVLHLWAARPGREPALGPAGVRPARGERAVGRPRRGCHLPRPGAAGRLPAAAAGAGRLKRPCRRASDHNGAGSRLPQADYVGYLRRLEQALILALGRFGVAGVQIPGLTGVWVEPQARPERQDLYARAAPAGGENRRHRRQGGCARRLSPRFCAQRGHGYELLAGHHRLRPERPSRDQPGRDLLAAPMPWRQSWRR